ncbi:uncharacterized protein N7483_007207 [Penicillium malachiteum]|uniref:uncharacterized protein n=1 Tax=Penicillium malachiteum TaxID=1324776 RepID=UPI0025480C8F|nr:uncharacterized protein N7483_007207 [Penicillium malachiteum]KAJ5725850.1 hypothetical protein N7483_007207 [Penicillium malachiteum]
MTNKIVKAAAGTEGALDGREIELLHYIYGREDLKELKGSPTKVLEAIDEFNCTQKMLMNIGPAKGEHVVNTINKEKPSVMIELGVYIGYSCILFGEALRANGGKKYIGIEKNAEMAAVANQLVDLAGLRDTVRILVGSSAEILRELIVEKEIDQIEIIFLDHWQELYLSDTWLLEEMNVMKPGVSVMIADNVIFPGAPNFRKWIEASTKEKKVLVKELESGLGCASVKPNPNLIYETVLEEFETPWGPDGVTFTRVVGEESSE